MDAILLGELETILNGMSITSNSNFTEIKNLLNTINTNSSNANSNASSSNSNTTTNNNASETGILSQKLSWLIVANKAHGSLERTSAGSQNWTCPTGVYFAFVVLVGGGGGGGGGGHPYYPSYSAGEMDPGLSGSGGGGGALVMAIVPVTPGSTYSVVCGAGGAAGSGGYSGIRAGSGGQSKFGTAVIADGGVGGAQPVAGDNYSKISPIGGDGGKPAHNFLTKCAIIIEEAGEKGTDGRKSSYNSDGYMTVPTGGSGGNGNLNKGAGGAGGNGSNTNGTSYPGSAGSAGYAFLFW